MDTPSLNDPGIHPSSEILKETLGNSFVAFQALIDQISDPQFGLVHEWRYYKDGKAWLCKVQFKKKTVFWLSAWDGYFKITFYFTEKHRAGIEELDIDDKIKSDFNQSKPIGKLIPLTMEIRDKEQFMDVIRIAELKKNWN